MPFGTLYKVLLYPRQVIPLAVEVAVDIVAVVPGVENGVEKPVDMIVVNVVKCRNGAEGARGDAFLAYRHESISLRSRAGKTRGACRGCGESSARYRTMA